MALTAVVVICNKKTVHYVCKLQKGMMKQLLERWLPAINNLNYYLLVSVKHKAFDYLEKMKSHAIVSFDDVDFEIGMMQAPNPETTLVSAENIRIIRAVINDLPPRCRLIFHLIKEEGLKYREAAERYSSMVCGDFEFP